MATVQKRTWLSRGPTGHKVRKVAWGYTLQVDGKQERCFRAEWTREVAQEELAKRLLARDTPAPAEGAAMTFGTAIARYLEVKKAKRGWKDDQRNLVRLRDAFGADRALREITAGRVAEYKIERARTLVRRDGELRPITAGTLNRELAVLRHLCTLAVEEWEVIEKAPHIRLEKEPEGRVVWLEATEEAALLAACKASQNPRLASLVTIALESGLRHSELLGLTWDRIDLSRGVMMLERTKSGKRREVPMRQAVYAIFAALPEPRDGRVWPDQSIRTAFENAVERAKLDDFTFHGCRHHFASWFMMRGGSLLALKELGGWRSLKMVERYAHLSKGHLAAEIEKTAAPTIATAPASAHDQHTVVESAPQRA